MGELISFPANGGTCAGYLAKPGGGDKAAGVVVIQEWWGLVGHIKDVVDRFASEGYHALAPDLYHGAGAIAHLRELTGKPVGIVGFCMGGALSLFAACDNPDSVAACADFYGGHPAIKPNLAALQAPVLGIFAERDDFVSPAVVKALDEQLTPL